MAGLKEIKRRLASVNNTKKITYAMKLVAAAKLRRVQEEVVGFRRYRTSLLNMNAQLQNAFDASSSEELSSDSLFSEERPVKSVTLFIVGGFRGLAGGYNSNINKGIDAALATIKDSYPSASISAIVIGKKAIEHLRKRQVRIEDSYDKLPDSVAKWPLNEIGEKVTSDYRCRKVDKTFLIYTEFRSALSQNVRIDTLLPFSSNPTDSNASSAVIKSKDFTLKGAEKGLGQIICEPSVEDVLSGVIQRIIKAELVYASLNAQASEHGSRMTAMDAATKNANDLVDGLRLTYNKLRQSGITSELLDIIGGAEAIS